MEDALKKLGAIAAIYHIRHAGSIRDVLDGNVDGGAGKVYKEALLELSQMTIVDFFKLQSQCFADPRDVLGIVADIDWIEVATKLNHETTK